MVGSTFGVFSVGGLSPGELYPGGLSPVTGIDMVTEFDGQTVRQTPTIANDAACMCIVYNM